MLLRIGEREVAAHEQQHAYHCHLSQLVRRVENLAAPQPAEGEHEDACDQEAYAAHQGGRNVLDRDVNAEIGRSPEEIDQREGKDHGKAVLALGLSHGLGGGKKQKLEHIRRLEAAIGFWLCATC